ncbi:MAG TPA: VanZ family protein [Bacillota bacterium]|nr:VanZ family protein [Bacillota bacterium]
MIQVPFPLIVAVVLPLWVFLRIHKAQHTPRFNGYRELLVTMFFIYGCALFVATMRPFLFQLPTLGPRSTLFFDFKLFEELRNMAEGYEMYQLLYSVGNVVMLIPFGLLLPLLFPFARHFLVTVLLGFSLSLTIEMTQMLFTVTRKGTVDDLVFNTIGALIGYVLFQIIGYKAVPKEKEKRKR